MLHLNNKIQTYRTYNTVIARCFTNKEISLNSGLSNSEHNTETNFSISTNKKLSILDLFSGIGGFALALKGNFTTSCYCEKDPIARAVLSKNMEEGHIDKAPIVEDIVNFIPRHTYDIIAFGWPCVGFSSAGKKEGFNNTQSALFYEVIRILRIQQAPYLIMENVPAVSKAMPEILNLLCNELGYSVFWVTIPASKAVGAPHQRLRWYGLAIHKNASPFNLPYVEPLIYDFSKEPCPRTAPDLTYTETYGRVSLLGNSVVPQAVATAWNHLVFYAKRVYLSYGIDNPTLNHSSLVLKRISKKKPAKNITKVNAGYCLRVGPFANDTQLNVMRIQNWQNFAQEKTNNGEIIVAPPGITTWAPYQETLLFNNNYLPQKKINKNQQLPSIEGTICKLRWGTPMFSMRGRANVLTKRTVNQLTTQVAFEKNTTNRESKINPVFVEFLMGYPGNYTALPNYNWEKLKKERRATFKGKF